MTLFSAVTSFGDVGLGSCEPGALSPRGGGMVGVLLREGDAGAGALRVGVGGWAICGCIDLCLGVGGGRIWGWARTGS